MQINPANSALQNFLDLVDASNSGLTLHVDQVTVANVQAYGPDGARNTQAEIDGISGHGFSGSTVVHYGRQSVAGEAASPVGPVPLPNQATEAEALQAVAAYFGFIPGEIEFKDAYVTPDTTAHDATITIGAKAGGSIVYLDDTVSITMRYDAPAG